MKATTRRKTTSRKAGSILLVHFLGAAGESIALAQSSGTFTTTGGMKTHRAKPHSHAPDQRERFKCWRLGGY
jgi:hypothetical protein